MTRMVDWPGANKTLRAPNGHEGHIADLRVFTNGFVTVSCWELDPADLREVLRTGKIFLSVFSGDSQPPVFLGTEDEVRGVVADYGPLWRKGT